MARERFDLSGKVALVTGASKGIGRAIAIELATAGADIIAVARTEKLLDTLAEEVKQIGRSILPVVGDLSDIAAIPGIVDEGLSRFGRIDILVNNAGITKREPVSEVTEQTWDAIMTVNVKAAFFLAKAVGSHMVERKQGKVINIGSEAALLGLPDHAVYCASKGALVQLSRALAAEWGQHNIQVNALCPGSTATDMTLPTFRDPAGREGMLGRMLLKRLVEPEEVAQAVLFLSSESASMITGQVICIDGGSTAI